MTFTDLSQASGSRGYLPRDFRAEPVPLTVSPDGVARAYDGPQLANDEERFDLIADKDRRGEWWDLICSDAGMRPKNQGRTSSCWMQSTTMLYEAVECCSGKPYVPKSPASVAYLLNGGRDVGGWCSQALRGIITHGIATEEEWPPNAFDRRYNTQAVQQARKSRVITEFDDLQPRDSRLLIDYVLLNGPAAVANMRWQHATLAMRVGVYKDRSGKRRFSRIDWNSGYGRDSKGITVLDESWWSVDEAVGIRVVTA